MNVNNVTQSMMITEKRLQRSKLKCEQRQNRRAVDELYRVKNWEEIGAALLKAPPPVVMLNGAPVERVATFKLHVASDLNGRIILKPS